MTQTDLQAVENLTRAYEALRSEIAKVIVGQTEVVEQLLIALLSNGHCLLVGVPGLAKTLLISTVAQVLNLRFSRIQFTPDLMPSDITGTDILEEDHTTGKRMFRFVKGPVFANIVLADEINRTPPKTQAALLEAMEERQVSIDGKTFPLSESFMVVATQNPIEQEGTYPLPEAQVDRFLVKIILDYPEASEEREIIGRYGKAVSAHDLEAMGLKRLPEGEWAVRLRKHVAQVKVEEGIVGYVQTLVEQTRNSPHIYLGASPRGGIALLKTSRCLAALEGRDYITPDDVKRMALPVLRHRVILRPEAELEGLNPDKVITRILDTVTVPR